MRGWQSFGYCLVYVLAREIPVADTVRERVETVGARQLAEIEHTMRLENQAAVKKQARKDLRRQD
jgi:hypothetical protein